MKKLEPVVINKFGEKLDTWVEVPDGQVEASVVMVHGFGTSKHETAHYFDDISMALVSNNFRVIRFDLSGYGNSEGKQEDACYSKHIGDLSCIIDYVKSQYSEPINIFAQSMGCFVTSLTNPAGITKTLMTGIPNSNPQVIIDRVSERFGARPGAILSYEGISLLPRSTGAVQKIGSNFWKDIRNLKPVSAVEKFSNNTNLLIIHWENDEILGTDYLDEYDKLPHVNAMWLPGDHSVTKKEDRDNLIKVMLDFFAK